MLLKEDEARRRKLILTLRCIQKTKMDVNEEEADKEEVWKWHITILCLLLFRVQSSTKLAMFGQTSSRREATSRHNNAHPSH
jgi:hypothetical protein